MLRVLLLILSLSIRFSSVAAENEVVSFGHNLTATSHTLKKNQWAVGLPIIAYGLTDNVTVGSSTWLHFDYNMYNMYVRYRFSQSESRTHALQLGYFNTYQEKTHAYDMSAAWLTYVKGWHYEKYNFFLNGQMMYFFDNNKPFSLRRPQLNDDPTEIVLSSLHEIELRNGFYLMGEMGFLGLARKYAYLHTGASLQWRAQQWLVQFGFSNTGTLDAYFSPSKRFDMSWVRHTTMPAADKENALRYDFSMHPEFVLQYYF